MAREANIDRDDEWFYGERKTLAYTVYEQDDRTVQDITFWTIEWRLHVRRNAVPSLVRPGVIVNGLAGLVDVEIAPSDYTNVPPGNYQSGLWRTNLGFESVLAYGHVVIRSIEEFK